MPTLLEIEDVLRLTERYYFRLRVLLGEVTGDDLDAKVGDGLTVTETIRHVCQADLWYQTFIDGEPRELQPGDASLDGLRETLARSEAGMIGFLQSIDPAGLAEERQNPSWWAEPGTCSGWLILMHSLAHKYYHCGQLQSILISLR